MSRSFDEFVSRLSETAKKNFTQEQLKQAFIASRNDYASHHIG